jgi:hypothetical protein
MITVRTVSGDSVTLALVGDTKYLTVARSDLNHISAGYIGVAAKDARSWWRSTSLSFRRR